MGAFITKRSKVDRDRNMIAGVEKHIDGPMLLDGVRYTPDQLIAMLAERADLSEAVNPASDNPITEQLPVQMGIRPN
jgi:hypothetical protein